LVYNTEMVPHWNEIFPKLLSPAPGQVPIVGGLNGSRQHLLKDLLKESRRLISFAGVNSNKTKALVRF
jgi:hypothetical protein